MAAHAEADTETRAVWLPARRHARRYRPRSCGACGSVRAAGACNRQSATLTYAYADSTAVVGPLATYSEPHSYDLCEEHALRLTVPRGWEVVRHEGEFDAPGPTVDDLLALADAVREAARPDRPLEPPEPPAAARPPRSPAGPARPGHRVATADSGPRQRCSPVGCRGRIR